MSDVARSAETYTPLAGLCISPPLERGTTNDTASRLCQRSFSLDHDKEPAELAGDLFEELDLESPGEDYRDSVSNLLAFARILRDDVFPGKDLIAGFVLLVFGGLVVLVPLYFKTGKKRDAFIMMLSALVLGFGIMAAAAAIFSLDRAVSLLEEVGPFTTGLAGSEPLAATTEGYLHHCVLAGIGSNGAFLFLVCLVGLIRRATQAKGIQVLPVFIQSAPPANHGPPNAKKTKRGMFRKGRR